MFILYEGADTLHLHQKHSDSSYLLLPQGAKIDVPHVHYALGGGATNVAVGLKKLGFGVEAFFKTGDDVAGCTIREELTQQKISTHYCPVDKEYGTALSIIIPSREHDHVALCYRAANRHQRKEDFPLKLLKDLDLLYMGPLGGHSQELLPYLAPKAQAAGTTVALNPSMAQLTQETDQLTEALKHTDILLVNRLESGYLMQALLQERKMPLFCCVTSDEPTLLNQYLSFNTTKLIFSLRDIAPQLLESGPKTIVITNGAEGVYVIHGQKIYFHPSIPTNPVYSLGAGDAFSSGFIGALTLGLPIEHALVCGIINASSVIQHPDAKEGLLSLDVLEKKAKNLPKGLLRTFDL